MQIRKMGKSLDFCSVFEFGAIHSISKCMRYVDHKRQVRLRLADATVKLSFEQSFFVLVPLSFQLAS